MTVINESGIYSLIMSSKLPKAKEFKRWVTTQILPTIRRTGGYVANEDMFIENYLPFLDEPYQNLFRLQMIAINQLNERIRHDQPLVEFANQVSDTTNLIDMNAMAKLAVEENIQIGRNRLFQWLREKGILMSNNLPYDLYELIEKEFLSFDSSRKHLYTEEILQNICLGLHSMCKGAESKYFDGHTNIRDGKFICFGVKGLMDTNKRLKDTLLFNILSYMSNQLLCNGNTVASVDELYLFLTNMTAIEYIRNGMKRVRKKESSFILSSQNIEDFLLPEIKEFTKPLFSIPSHHFLFNPGNISPVDFMDTLQVEKSEYGLIKYPERGTCLYRCGNERYLLQVHAPDYKVKLFGKAGGR